MTDNHGLNLKPHRAPVSVWDRRGWDGTRERLAITRLLIGIGGGALALHGLRNRTIAGGLLAGVGGTLVRVDPHSARVVDRIRLLLLPAGHQRLTRPADRTAAAAPRQPVPGP